MQCVSGVVLKLRNLSAEVSSSSDANIIERDLEHSLFCTSPENIDYARRGATYHLALP